jgi:hypothetical protein
MDRKYIDSEHIVERYLAGELTVREARDFERYCLEHPDLLNELPIPVRLKARLARRPAEESETGIFQTIPSTTTHVAVQAADDGFDYEGEQEARHGDSVGASRLVVAALVVALLGALAGLAVYAMRAGSLQKQLHQITQAARETQMRAPAGVQTYTVQPVRAEPAEPTLQLGWLSPPQRLELRINVSEGKFTQFQVTIDKIGDGQLMQMRRLTRDSNRELRLALNSSAFGPGEYLLRLDAYNWRGQTQPYGWIRVGLQ